MEKKYFNNYKYPCSLLKILSWSFPVMDLKSTNTSGTSEVTWGSDPSSSSQPLLQIGPCSSAYGFSSGSWNVSSYSHLWVFILFLLKCPSLHRFPGQSSLCSSDLSPHTDCSRKRSQLAAPSLLTMGFSQQALLWFGNTHLDDDPLITCSPHFAVSSVSRQQSIVLVP